MHINKKGAKIDTLRELVYGRMAEKISSGLSEAETAIFTELLGKIVRHSGYSSDIINKKF